MAGDTREACRVGAVGLMIEIIRRTEAELRAEIAEVEAAFPDIASFSEEDAGCRCCAEARFADVHGWANIHHWTTWDHARYLLGEDR